MLHDLATALWTTPLATWVVLLGYPLLAYVLFLYVRWAATSLWRWFAR